MKEIKNLTGVCVEYATPALLKKAIDSIRMFYDFPIIVINGSDEKFEFENTKVIDVGYNIGHGLGMDMGIKMAETDYVLTFDTDIEILRPCLTQMLNKMEEDTYAIGKVYLKNNTSTYLKHIGAFTGIGVVRIVHPSFQIVNKKEYLKYAPYISDGAPTILSYHDLARRKIDNKVLIDFPVLDFIEHRNAGTRDMVDKTEYESEDNPSWIEKWKTYIGNHPL